MMRILLGLFFLATKKIFSFSFVFSHCPGLFFLIFIFFMILWDSWISSLLLFFSNNYLIFLLHLVLFLFFFVEFHILFLTVRIREHHVFDLLSFVFHICCFLWTSYLQCCWGAAVLVQGTLRISLTFLKLNLTSLCICVYLLDVPISSYAFASFL